MSYREYKAYITNDVEKLDNKGYNKSRQAVVEYRLADEKIINNLQKQSDIVYKELTIEERKALSEYTQGGYLDINSDLANGIENKYTLLLNKAINKFNLEEDLITYRGTRKEFYKNYKIGDTFKEKIFYSTSIDLEQAQAFSNDWEDDGILLEIKIPKNTKCLYIGSNTDYEVNEYELLLSNQLKYAVENIEKSKIVLKVVNDED